MIKNLEEWNYFNGKRIEWKFIIDRTAWWGSFYERLVHSTKIYLKKLLGKSSLEYKEFQTTLQEAESFLNSCPSSTFNLTRGANEPSPLCLTHFLVRKKLTALPPKKIRVTSFTKNELTRKYRHRLNLVQKISVKKGNNFIRWTYNLHTKQRAPKVCKLRRKILFILKKIISQGFGN